MRLRPTTVRRLFYIGVAMALIAAVGGTMWLVNSRKNAARIAQARADGMAAFAKNDYASALPFFSTYLSDSKTAEKSAGQADAEALLAYGKSRQAIALPRGRHLFESIKIFELYLRLKPGDAEARKLLLELYPRVKYNEEAINLANTVLADDPANIPAMRAKVIAFFNQRKFKESLAVADALVKQSPNDLQGHAYVQTLMMSLERPGEPAGEKIVARYTQLLRDHPDDARFELLLARAYHFANEQDKAAQWLKSAAARKPTDPELASVLTSMLEKYNLFRESNDVLEQLAQSDDDAMHVRPLVRRMWQSGRAKDVLKRTEDQDPASPLSDTDLLAYRALALYDLNRPTDAAAVVAGLASRKDDMVATAWVTALKAREDDNLAPRERVRRYQEALERSPDNEVVYFFLGEAYVSLGESEPALQAWRQAATRAPSWSAPAAAIARTLAATGRSAEALSAAREAYRRAPRIVSTTTGFAVAWFADQQQNPDPAEQKKLLELVEKIQEQIPREPETLHIYASLLSRTGQRDKAIALIKSALAPEISPPPRETLLSLAAVSFAEKLGLEQQVLDFADSAYGLSPAIAIRKAILLSQAGKSKDGLKFLEAARQKDTKADPTQWALAIVQFRESLDDETVLPDWIKLGDANPDNAPVQSAILRSPSRLSDKAFWLRSIERLKKLTGDEAVTPRVERARWLLTGETTEKEASEAIVLLRAVDRTELPEIHRLLGIAHEKNAAHKTGAQRDELLRTAAGELEKAFASRDADAEVATDLTRVYRAMGRNSDAERVMSRITDRAADMGVDGRRRVARTLVLQGQLQKAIEVLEPVGNGQDVLRDAMLCSLYRQTGQVEKTSSLYGALLADSRSEGITIAEGADFFADRGDAAQAEKFLARLRTMEIGESTRNMLLARYAERHGAADDARQGFEAAVAADPAQPAAWQALVGFHLRRLAFADAIEAVDRGLKALPDDTNLRSLRARAVAMLAFKTDPNLSKLADELSVDPQSGAITDMLRIMADAKKSGEPMEKTMPKLRELADANPDLIRLQMFVAEGYTKIGQFDEAEKVATRAAVRAPNDPEPARVLTAVYSAKPGKDRWLKVLDSARQWRQRAMNDPIPADITIARTLLELNRAAEAVKQLKPDVPAKLAPEKANPGLLGVYAQALIQSGSEKQASDLLLPLAKTSAGWRRVWLQVAVAAYDKPEPAIKWIGQIEPLISTDVTEQIALAESWCAVGSKTTSPAAFNKAKAVIEPLTTNPAAGISGWRLLASVSESTSDMAGATRAYRKLLAAQPDDADLRNNLAYALLESGDPKDLPEARTLAEAAVGKSPTNPTYLDTLARVHLKSGDLPASEQAFQRAIDAGQPSIEALVGMADVQNQLGRPEKTRDLLAKIDKAITPASALPAALQKQLDALRVATKSPVQSGRLD